MNASAPRRTSPSASVMPASVFPRINARGIPISVTISHSDGSGRPRFGWTTCM
jgi:hypothetical protein